MALWTPEYIDTELWLDAADSDTITESGGAVSQWADKSGNARDARQETGSLQPTTGANTLGGLNVITYDLDQLKLSSDVPIRAAFFVTSTLLGCNVNSNVSPIFGGLATTNHDYVFVYNLTAYDISIDGENSKPGSAGVDGGALVAGTNIDLGLTPTEIEGDRLWSVTFNANANIGNIGYTYTTGGHRYLNGRLAELVFLSEIPSTDIRQTIEGYLAHKWGLEANLPVGHPYESDAPLSPYSVSGAITGADGNPAARVVRLYSRSTGALLGEQTSDGTSGEYDIGLRANDEVQRIVLADEASLHNDIIDRVIPG
jgi:hypothetical protein